MRVFALLGVALMLAGSCAAADEKPAEKEEKQESKAQTERVTPFGGAIRQQKSKQGKTQGLRSKGEAPRRLRAYDEGDEVRFETRLPFGTSQYRKKKSELNEAERAALERDRKKKPAGK